VPKSQGAAVGRGELHIDHLHGGQLFEDGDGVLGLGEVTRPGSQRGVECKGHVADEDVGLHTLFKLMVDGTDAEISFEFVEGLLHLGLVYIGRQTSNPLNFR
jgi:hypothetical protein